MTTLKKLVTIGITRRTRINSGTPKIYPSPKKSRTTSKKTRFRALTIQPTRRARRQVGLDARDRLHRRLNLLFIDECDRIGGTGADAQTAAVAKVLMECQRAVRHLPGAELAAIHAIATVNASR